MLDAHVVHYVMKQVQHAVKTKPNTPLISAYKLVGEELMLLAAARSLGQPAYALLSDLFVGADELSVFRLDEYSVPHLLHHVGHGLHAQHGLRLSAYPPQLPGALQAPLCAAPLFKSPYRSEQSSCV